MLDVIFAILAIIVVVLIWIMLYDSNRFVLRKYHIENEKIGKNFRAVVLADLHDKQYGRGNEQLLLAIKEQKPDMILIAGDMITATPKGEPDKTLDFLEKVSKEYPIYYGVGNHEYRYKLYPEKYGSSKERFEERMKDMQVALMENCKREVTDSNVVVYGLELDKYYYKRFEAPQMEEGYLQGTLGDADQDKFTILLAHNPDYFTEYAAWGADLVLSGHVHGGMVRIPGGRGVVSPAVRLFPKYDGGMFEEKKSKMILSRGLGMHTIPLRLFNPGELIVIDFANKSLS